MKDWGIRGRILEFFEPQLILWHSVDAALFNVRREMRFAYHAQIGLERMVNNHVRSVCLGKNIVRHAARCLFLPTLLLVTRLYLLFPWRIGTF